MEHSALYELGTARSQFAKRLASIQSGYSASALKSSGQDDPMGAEAVSMRSELAALFVGRDVSRVTDASRSTLGRRRGGPMELEESGGYATLAQERREREREQRQRPASGGGAASRRAAPSSQRSGSQRSGSQRSGSSRRSGGGSRRRAGSGAAWKATATPQNHSLVPTDPLPSERRVGATPHVDGSRAGTWSASGVARIPPPPRGNKHGHACSSDPGAYLVPRWPNLGARRRGAASAAAFGASDSQRPPTRQAVRGFYGGGGGARVLT